MHDSINRALVALDYALIVEQPEQYLIEVRKILLNLGIDLQIAADARVAATEELPELVVDKTKERHFEHKDHEPVPPEAKKYAKRAGNKVTKDFKCPTCDAPPWHYCSKTSMRGQGNAPLGSTQKFDHPARIKLARDWRERQSKKKETE